MKIQNKKFLFLYILSMFVQILPLPGFFQQIRPDLLICILLTQVLFYKYSLKFFSLIFVSFCFDIINTDTLGMHLFAITLVLFLANYNTRSFLLYNLPQQITMIFIYVFLYHSTLYSINHVMGIDCSFATTILISISTAILWPWVNIYYETLVLRDLKIKEIIINSME